MEAITCCIMGYCANENANEKLGSKLLISTEVIPLRTATSEVTQEAKRITLYKLNLQEEDVVDFEQLTPIQQFK